jgi:hypothetical protein
MSALALYNRTTSTPEMVQSNEELTLVASAAYTADQPSLDQVNPGAAGLTLMLSVTVNASSETITLYLQTKDPISGNYINLANSGALNTSPTGAFAWQPNVSLPRTWRVNADKSAGNSVTFSVGGSYSRASAFSSVGITGTVTIAGSVTADTELPAAVLLADNTALPTTPVVGAALMGYDGTTLDLLRSANAGHNTAGDGILAAGNMGYVPSENKSFRLELRNQTTLNNESQGYILPTAMYAWNYDAGGATAAIMYTGTLDGTFSNARRLMTQADIVVYDGAQFRSVRGDSTGTLRAAPYATAITNSAAVQAAAYAAADLAGGKRTWANAVRISGGSARIKGILIGDQAANSAANSVYDLILFNSDPSGTTFTENSPLDVADADLSKTIAVIRIDGVAGVTLFTNADNQVLFKQVDIPITLSATTTLYGALIVRGGPTYAATTDVFVTLQLEQF